MTVTKKRVFIPDRLNEDALAVLRDCPDVEVDYRPELTTEEKLEATRTASALIVRSGTRVTQAGR